MEIPLKCPVCGAYSLTQEDRASTLLAVCDVLVLKALESLGKWIVRSDRSRYATLGGRPYYLAHTVWRPEEALVVKALRGAWDVVPPLLRNHTTTDEVPAARVSDMLDSYVRDLAITGTAHRLEELHYRFRTRLSLPVYLKEPT